MVMVVVFTPPLFLAVIVYVVLVDNSVGVPEISPVNALKFKPAGRSGLIEYPYIFEEESKVTYLRSSLVLVLSYWEIWTPSLESMAIDVQYPTEPVVSREKLSQLLAVVQPLEQVAYLRSLYVVSW